RVVREVHARRVRRDSAGIQPQERFTVEPAHHDGAARWDLELDSREYPLSDLCGELVVARVDGDAERSGHRAALQHPGNGHRLISITEADLPGSQHLRL